MSIASEITRLQQAKSDLATSITNKGVTVPSSATLDDYPALVDQIQQGGGGTLPYDAEIEYLKGDGNAYINTGIVPSSDIQLTVDGWYSVTSGSNLAFGAIQSGSYPRFHLGINNSNFSAGVGTVFGNIRSPSTHRYNFIIDGRDAKAYTTSGNVTGSYTGNSTYPTIPIFLFARNFDGVASNMHVFSLCSAHIYSYSTGKMLVDFIPVRVGTTGYLYDKVSKTLFGNAGSGAFVLGPDVT